MNYGKASPGRKSGQLGEALDSTLHITSQMISEWEEKPFWWQSVWACGLLVGGKGEGWNEVRKSPMKIEDR